MKTKVLIAGGGIAGLALALKLGESGIPCIVIDPQKPQKYDFKQHGGRTAALMGESIELLSDLGLWDIITQETAPLETMRIIDDSSSRADPVQIDFKARDEGINNFGHNVPNCYLRSLLFEQCKKQKNVTLLVPSKLEKFDVLPNKVIAVLDNGKKIEASLLVGGDGRNSLVRRSAHIDIDEIDYKQMAITCLISHEKEHGNISVEHHRPGGPFTLVPMPTKNGKQYSSVVWVEDTDDAQSFIALDKESFDTTLQQKTNNIWGSIAVESAPEAWPLKALLAKEIIADRVALIAEAGHAMSPIGAQGLNLSLRDVSALAKIIIDTIQLGGDIGSEITLKQYERARRLDWQTRFHGVDQYNKIVSNNVVLLRGIRRAGLKTIKTIPAFKNLAVKIGLRPAA
ncbi:MAG: FAD-dependent monooxygenase [Pseudomonadota bacterium]